MQRLISIWVVIDTSRSDDAIRQPQNAILAFWWRRRADDVKMMSILFQQWRHILIQQIKPPNKSFNLNREILSKFWLKSLKIGSTLL